MDIAVVGSAARIRVDPAGRCADADLVLGSVAPTAVEVDRAAEILSGRRIPLRRPEHPLWIELGDAAAERCDPIDDKRGTAGFRRRVARVLARRTVVAAARRAGESR